ncbi:MAG: SurA N-terminal domain-containing protein [Deltaproteobacteria bacterium]|nr:SurA N-terminal domain-containing protein [Deltaproteobacteria bacterium]
MLDILRQNAKSTLTYALFGIIIVVFVVSFGPGSKGCSDARVTQASWAAQVNGVDVSGADFEQYYAGVFRSYQARAGQGFTREVAEQLGLRKVTMDQVVERELLIQEGARLGIVVSDEDLSRAIQQMPSFRVNGAFDKDAYERAAAATFGSAKRYEDRLRRDLLAQKTLALLRETSQVSGEEVRQAFDAESDRVDLEYVRFPTAGLRAAARPTAAEVQAFQARNGERIGKYYKDNAARFDRKKRVQARHILIRADEKAPADVDAAAKKKADEALARIQKGEDFARLASQLSEDPGSKERGGDLGWFGSGVMAKPFEEAAFAAQKGALTGPVRTRFGWHVIQVTGVQEPEVVPLEKAAPEIAGEMLQEDLARAAALKRAEEALAQARKGKGFGELFPPEPDPKAARKGPAPVKLGGELVRPDETGPFGVGTRPTIPRLGAVPALFDDAFAATGARLLDKVYDSPGGPVIARVKSRQRPDPAQFAARKGDVEVRLRARREAQVEQAWMKALREKADVKVNQAYLRGEVTLPPVQLD